MKRLAISLLIIFSFTTLLVPGMAFAEATAEEKATATEKAAGGEKVDALVKTFKSDSMCISDEEKTSMIYTVLETPIDSAEDEAAYDTGKGVIDNGDGTQTRRCYRFTGIHKNKKIPTDQYLIKKCPDEANLSDGSYGMQTNGDYFDCQEVTVIMSAAEQGGIGVLNVYISLIYRWVAGIVGVIAVLIIIVSGLQIITAQGESEAITAGKKRIIQSIGGIVLLFFATGLLYMINPTFFNPPDYNTTSSTLDPATQKALDKQPFGEDFGKVEGVKPLSLSEPDASSTPAKHVESSSP